MLASLAEDENNLEKRKANVQRFGAGWIRPPGIAKTLQAITDEEHEKHEQEIMARREQAMLDLAAAQQEAANAEERVDREEMEDNGEMEEERDLDDDVPEADASASDVSSDEEEEEEEEEEESVSGTEHSVREQDTTMPFNEDSFIEGSMVEAEVSAMLEQEEAEMAGVLQDERDLDDDIPEAGSYEHTDSELEDSSEDDAASRPPGFSSVRTTRSMRRNSGFQSAGRNTGRRSAGRRSSGLPPPSTAAPQRQTSLFAQSIGRGIDLGASLGNGRSSFGMEGSSSILEGSSFLRSSPAVQRTNLRDQFLRAARGGRRG